MIVVVLVVGLWGGALLLVGHEESQLQQMLAAQQLSTARYIANEIDSKVRLRLDSLALIAAHVPSPIEDTARLHAFLLERRAIYNLCDLGLIVIKPDLSAAYDDWPALPGRRNGQWHLSPFEDVARTGNVAVGAPRIGRYSRKPLVPMGVPIKDAQGRLRGILAGITSIDAPFFLEPLTQFKQYQGGSIEIVAPHSGLVLTASEHHNRLVPLPPVGAVPFFDRLIGHEGSLIGQNAAGVEELASSTRIASTNWSVIVRVPTEQVFAPIRAQNAWIWAGVVGLSLIVGVFTVLLVRRNLRPMAQLAKQLDAISRGAQALHALPAQRPDEVGLLIDSFNRLQARLLEEQTVQRESEERLRTLIEAIPDAIQFKDSEGRWLAFNRIAQRAFGLEQVDCRGRSDTELAELAPPTFHDALLQCRETDEAVWQAGHTSRVEETMALADGSTLTFDVIKVPLFEADGARKGLVIVGRDVTAARRAETELRQLSEAVRQSSEAIVVADTELHFQYINPAFERLLGYTLDEVRGQSLSILVPEETALRGSHALVTEGPFQGERLRRAKDGRLVPVLLSVAPIRDSDGHVLGMVGTMTDLSLIKQTEARLENERAHLRTLVQTIPDLVWLKDPDGVYLSCNPEFERFFGATEADIVGKTDHDFVDAELADFFRQKDREAMAAGRPSVNEEWITYASDGHRALLETVKTPMCDRAGHLIGVLGIARDITEHRRLDEAIREGESKYRSLFETANDGIFVQETAGFTFVDCNERGAAMYGLRREEVIGRSPAELTPERQPDGRLSSEVAMTQIQAAMAGQPQHFEWQSLHADGTPFDVEINLNRIELGGQPHLQATVRDITERKAAERQLQREHAFRQKIIDSIPGAFYLFDRAGRFLMWNRQLETVLGRSAEEVQSAHPLEFFDPEDKHRVEQAIREVFEGGVSQVEASFLAKDGTRTPYYFSGFHFVLETGEPALIGVGIDITERRAAEEALRESEVKLRGLFALSPLGIALTDMSGHYVEFNEAFRTICGYPLEELNSLDYWTLTPKKYEAQEQQQLDLLARTGYYGPYEKEYRRKDGSLIPLRLNGMLVVGSDGQQYIWSIVEDITQQKAAEATIQHLNADLSATLHAVPDLLFDLDRNGTYLGIWAQNPALLAAQKEILLGHTVTEKLPADAAAVVMTAIGEADDKGHSYGKIISLDLADGTHWFELSTAKKADGEGGTARFIMLARDITERKRWEEKLRESEERWKFALEGSGDGVWDWNIQTGDAVFSTRWKEMLGFADSEIANNASEWTARVHPEDMPRVMAALQVHIDGETASAAIEFRMLCKDGGWKWILGRGIVVSRASDGSPLRLVGTNTDITERKRVEAALQESELRYRTLAERSPLAIQVFSPDGTTLRVNQAWENMWGVPFAALSQYNVLADTQLAGNGTLPLLKRAFGGETVQTPAIEYDRLRAKEVPNSGGKIWVRSFVYPVRGEDGTVLEVVAIQEDVTQQRLAEEKIILAASVFANSYDGVIITDADNVILDVNPAFTRITGYSREEAIGQSPKFLASGRQQASFYASLWQSLRERDFWQGEIWNRRKTGEVYAEMLAISVVRDDVGRLQHYIGVFTDINQIKAHEAELDRIAHYDALTCVPNRRLLADRLEQAIFHAQRSRKSLALCYLDLDGFKPVNDRYGHAVGDELLIEITARLKEVLRAEDTLARLGGDEFVLIFTDLAQPGEIHIVLNRVLAAVSAPILFKDIAPITVSASIGVTLYPEDDTDADTLLRHADHAMYLAKDSGKNRYRLFVPEHGPQL